MLLLVTDSKIVIYSLIFVIFLVINFSFSTSVLKCLEKSKVDVVIAELHSGVFGGHKYWKANAFKILRAGYYWPTLFSYVYHRVRSCVECQKFASKHKLQSLPLKPISVNGPFQQWGLDFIDEIHPPSSGQHKWILTATDFFTKWVEAVPTRRATGYNYFPSRKHSE